MPVQEKIVDYIVSCMALHEGYTGIQQIQTQHRLRLAQFWDIKPNSRVLEIGCGQGDTTAVLAYQVGEEGHVYGVDIASPDYGSPITVGDAAHHLQSSRLGKQIEMHYEFDVLSPEVDFPENHFDQIVLSHCSWYLPSFEVLYQIVEKVKKWGKQLCFSEWDTRFQKMEQYPHFLAVVIQSQYECFKANSHANVRTLLTPDDIRELTERAGWKMVREESITSSQLQDGKWEVEMTLANYQNELDALSSVSSKFRSHIQSEVKLLKEASTRIENLQSLPTYVFVAEKGISS